LVVTFIGLGLGGSAFADGDKDSLAILDKAIKALGGEEKLSGIQAATWKAKGTRSFGGKESEFTSQSTVQGFDHYRREMESEFNGNPFKFVMVLNGDKAWRKFGDNNKELDSDAVAAEKRSMYLQTIPAVIFPLKGTGFKAAAAGEEKVGDKTLVAIKATGPDGKDFKLYFDNKTGLPAKQVGKVTGFNGQEFTQETTFSNYKDFNGIKIATKVEYKRDGEKFMDQEITDFLVLNKVDPKTFAEPE
jgi:hypothetical protein